MNDAKKLLEYWYNLEFFSPFWPKMKELIYIGENKRTMPWSVYNPKYNYDLYLGKMQSYEFIVKMLNALGLNQEDNVEKDNALTCVCAIKVSNNGYYIDGSFTVATFIWAVAKIIKGKNLRTLLTLSEVDQFNNKINDWFTAIEGPINYDHIRCLLVKVMKELALNASDCQYCGLINKVYIKQKNNDKTGDIIKDKQNKNEESNDYQIENTTDMLSSFYADDLRMVKNNLKPEERIIKYIEALLNNNDKDRIQIDKNINQMKKWLSPDHYPLGKWPSIYSPSLMQQLAINIAISDHPESGNIFSINGPPGTGKTTLLKEIIASYIVDRAFLLSKYNEPNDAFSKKLFKLPPDEFTQTYYELDQKLKRYGIIVASNNNAAVENISKELPSCNSVNKANTNLFMQSEVYFSEIASRLMEKSGSSNKCWGLISASLGKSSNIGAFKQTLWFDKSITNLQQLYGQPVPNWNKAKKQFLKKYNQVISCRNEILQAVKKIELYNHKKTEYDQTKSENEKLIANIEKQQKCVNDTAEKQNEVQNEIKTAQQNVELLKSRLSLFKKLLQFLFKNDPIIIKLHQLDIQINKNMLLLIDINTQISSLKSDLDNLHKKADESQKSLILKQQQLENLKKSLEWYKSVFGTNYTSEKFWTNIVNNVKSQSACPWTNKHYDTLREELFYQALILQKAFVLNSTHVKQNINCLVKFWNNALSEDDKKISFSDLLNTLLLIVPVASTTFASVTTFLNYAGRDQLGTLIIDEAGQATPQSAVGVLWRTSKAIVVGDPMQVEPVVTIPKELAKRFAEEFEIDDKYKQRELSVQVLADTINPFGGYRKYTNGKLWVGCPLVIHRRCIDPMFSISNDIAYNNRMFNKTDAPDPDMSFIISKSEWIDISGKESGKKDHFVQEQGIKAAEMVVKAFHISDTPSLYIISPFTSVVQGLKHILRQKLYYAYPQRSKYDINDWIENSCGTIHTFQGKEANEVILVLGCDNYTGINAANWVGSKPNIINVAVSRAKYRLAVIGDSMLWSKIPNVDDVYLKLTNNI